MRAKFFAISVMLAALPACVGDCGSPDAPPPPAVDSTQEPSSAARPAVTTSPTPAPAPAAPEPVFFSVFVTRAADNETDVIVKNLGLDPILILATGQTSNGVETETSLAERFKGERAQDGTFTVEGKLLVEDIGPQARLPGPPRWRFEGSEEAVFAPIVAPGATWKTKGMAFSGPGTVFVKAVALKRGTPVLKVESADRFSIHRDPDAGLAEGWVPTARVTLRATPVQAVDPKAHQRAFPWAVREKLPFSLAEPELPKPRPYAVFARDLEGARQSAAVTSVK